MRKLFVMYAVIALLVSCQQTVQPDRVSITEKIETEARSLPSTFVKSYGGSGFESAQSMVKTSDGGYALLGFVQVTENNSDFYLVKTDCYGKMQWQKTYGNSAEIEIGNCIRETPDKGFILTGYGKYKAKIIKTDKNGVVQWESNIADSLVSGRAINFNN